MCRAIKSGSITAVAPKFYVPSPVNGVWLVLAPFLVPPGSLVTIPGSGQVTLQVAVADLPSGSFARTEFVQGIAFDAAGKRWIGSPLHRLTLDRASLPDCDGNAQSDLVDILGGAQDLDHNLSPDVCDADCNMNGIADGFDIQSGTSVDLNHNGMPDECEPITTWYVDDSAAPGGNGGVAAPFQALGSAFGAAVSGDTIVVADGSYIGPQNRELDFNGRTLDVHSVNGPANCVIDPQSQGRAMVLRSTEGTATTIEGFTFRNARALIAYSFTPTGGAIYAPVSLTIRDCVFDHCAAPQPGGCGGAVFLGGGRIESCTFDACSASSGGGALWIQVEADVLRCQFRGNSGSNGGAIQGVGVGPIRIESSTFVDNSTYASFGGAVAINTQYAGGTVIDDCVFTGNSAYQGGGAVAFYPTSGSGAGSLVLSNSTLIGNRCQTVSTQYKGGGLLVANAAAAEIANSILWNNFDAGGAPRQLALGPQAASLSVAFCDVEGGAAGVFLGGGSLQWGAGNVSVDPQCVDLDGSDNNVLTGADNDLHLALNSPCIDAGDNALIAADAFDLDGDGNVSEPVPFDLDGQPRRVDVPTTPDTGAGVAPIVDLGCFEHP